MSPFTALKIASPKPQSHWKERDRRHRHEPEPDAVLPHWQCEKKRLRLQFASRGGPSVGLEEAGIKHGWASTVQKQRVLTVFPICSEKQPPRVTGVSHTRFFLTFSNVIVVIHRSLSQHRMSLVIKPSSRWLNSSVVNPHTAWYSIVRYNVSYKQEQNRAHHKRARQLQAYGVD